MSTVTSKGQVTVPKKIREYLGLRTGSAVSFGLGAEGEIVVRNVGERRGVRRKGRFDAVRGTLKTGKRTDDLMRLLRGYDADPGDPGLRDGSG